MFLGYAFFFLFLVLLFVAEGLFSMTQTSSCSNFTGVIITIYQEETAGKHVKLDEDVSQSSVHLDCTRLSQLQRTTLDNLERLAMPSLQASVKTCRVSRPARWMDRRWSMTAECWSVAAAAIARVTHTCSTKMQGQYYSSLQTNTTRQGSKLEHCLTWAKYGWRHQVTLQWNTTVYIQVVKTEKTHK